MRLEARGGGREADSWPEKAKLLEESVFPFPDAAVPREGQGESRMARWALPRPQDSLSLDWGGLL